MERAKSAAASPEAAMEAPQAYGAEVLEGLLMEYAVTSKSGLNLRDAPSLDGAVLAELPQGDGVYSYGEAEGGWLRVRTGRLEGWMLAEHLEEVPLPELSAYGLD